MIAEIDADAPAGKVGLREGDVIQEMNKQSVHNAKESVEPPAKNSTRNEKIFITSIARLSGYVTLEPNRGNDEIQMTNDELMTKHNYKVSC